MKQRIVLFAVLWVVSIAGAATISAQIAQRVFPPGHVEQVITGEELGFKVEGEGRDGRARGRFVVKIDGQWRDIELVPRIRTVR